MEEKEMITKENGNKKIAIVTGASSGMGREFVRQLDLCTKTIEEIWVIARRKERLIALAEEMHHVKIRIFALDICDAKQLEEFEQLLIDEKPSVRLLINSAGVGKSGRFEDLSRQDVENMVILNDLALVSVTHMVLPYMIQGGNIIQMASAAGFFPQKNFAVYAASKAFVLRFSKALRAELSKKKIYVTAVCPGPVNTEFLEISNGVGIPNSLKQLTMVEAQPVVAKALRDAKKGKSISVYGIMKVVHVASKLLPGDWIARLL